MFSGFPYIYALLNCLICMWYGTPLISPDNLMVLTVNTAGAFVQFVYIILFVIYAKKNRKSQKQHLTFEEPSNKDLRSSSKCSKLAPFESVEHEQPRTPPIRPLEKRQRVLSAYNQFIKEEIQRIKASNPDISHREAFGTAAKNVILCLPVNINTHGYNALRNVSREAKVKLQTPRVLFHAFLKYG